jgi:flagellar hook protein FlgE
MSILKSLTVGVSGLRANSEALGVAGDNIANVNTVGFKRSRAVFEDVLGRSVSTYAPIQSAGAGTRMASVQQMWAQGALVTTDSPTDLAISGDGFFVVAGNQQGADGRYYTRAGQFHVDKDGKIVNTDDLRLQGYTAAPDGTMGSTIGDLVVTGGTVPANPTTLVNIAANLDASTPLDPNNAPFDPLNASKTSAFSQNVTVYDSLGAAHELTVFYHKSADNTWDWHALVDSGELAGGTAGTPTEVASGDLTFTTDGKLDTDTVNANTVDFGGGATAGQVINFDFGTSITGDQGTGLDGTTQFASKSVPVELRQDGYAAGSVAGISIAGDGKITGVFSNGQQRVLGQVVTADFANLDGLQRTGNGMWIESQGSGQPLIGGADAGGRGAIVSGSLEQANVDLGGEFVNLIAYQRGFQANSRVITTADEMYSELVNLKR